MVESNPPDQYQLHSSMDAGIAGMIDGHADVTLKAKSEELTEASYIAHVHVSGWVGSLGTRLLGHTAQKYMEQFFANIVCATNQKKSGLENP